MSIVWDSEPKKNVKVIAVYLGPRRSVPSGPRETYPMLRFLLDCERSVDAGCEADTLLVYNREPSLENGHEVDWLRRCEDLLDEADGAETVNGTIKLVSRENVGLSLGAYNHAFTWFGDRYDYWLFTEDDQVMVGDGTFACAIEQMKANPKIGFVAIVGVSTNRQHPPHVHGGVGVSSRQILNEIKAANASDRHPEGQLPYHIGKGYDNQRQRAEIRFTNVIHQRGYRLVDLAMERVCMSWGHRKPRTPRMAPWDESLAQDELACAIGSGEMT
jgi:hypothetical protein